MIPIESSHSPIPYQAPVRNSCTMMQNVTDICALLAVFQRQAQFYEWETVPVHCQLAQDQQLGKVDQLRDWERHSQLIHSCSSCFAIMHIKLYTKNPWKHPFHSESICNGRSPLFKIKWEEGKKKLTCTRSIRVSSSSRAIRQIAWREMPRSGFSNFVEKMAAADSDAQKVRGSKRSQAPKKMVRKVVESSQKLVIKSKCV